LVKIKEKEMDKELRNLDKAIEYENLHLKYRKELVLFRERIIERLECEKIERLVYLIQERITVREKGIEKFTLQEKFVRRDLRKIHNKETFFTLSISESGYLIYCIYGSRNEREFDFEDDKLIASIARKPVISVLLEIYKNIN